MKSNHNHRLALGLGYLFIGLSGLMVSGCAKTETSGPLPIDTTKPAPTAPSGIITEFFVRDTLVGYEHATVVRWYVTGTNQYTQVTLNGVKVAFSGSITTAPLTGSQTFVLALNNGAKVSKTICVSDRLATALWNTGRRWRLTDYLVWKEVTGTGSQGQDSMIHTWVSMRNTDQIRLDGMRVTFSLDSTYREEQVNYGPPQVLASGKLVPVYKAAPDLSTFAWRYKMVTVDTLTASRLVISFDSTMSGSTVRCRYAYLPE